MCYVIICTWNSNHSGQLFRSQMADTFGMGEDSSWEASSWRLGDVPLPDLVTRDCHTVCSPGESSPLCGWDVCTFLYTRYTLTQCLKGWQICTKVLISPIQPPLPHCPPPTPRCLPPIIPPKYIIWNTHLLAQWNWAGISALLQFSEHF